MISKRRGRFSISMEYFENCNESDNIFKGMLILEAQHNYSSCGINYLAIHSSFKECGEGCEAPTYRPIFKDLEIFPEWVCND